jgi:photosystem II stability/assembly factor-like uncharacterized protein
VSSAYVFSFDQLQAGATNEQTVTLVGNGGVVLSSADDARSWERQTLAQPSSLIGVAACPDGSFIALDYYHKVWVGDARGENWTARTLSNVVTPLALTCDPKGSYWVVGSNSSIQMSADRGQTWNETQLGEDVLLTAVQFVDSDVAFVAGEFGVLLVTSDRGRTWQRRPPLEHDFYPYALYFKNRSEGWASGLAGRVLHTDDGGMTWRPQESRPGLSIYAIASAAGLFAVGDRGEIFVYSENAQRWEGAMHVEAARSFLRAVVPLRDARLLVAGADGALAIVNARKLTPSPSDKFGGPK